jgi:membrane protein
VFGSDTERHTHRIAFLAPHDLSEADLSRSLQALEGVGIPIEVITAASDTVGGDGGSRIGPGPAEPICCAGYSALAMPAPVEHTPAGRIDAQGLRLVQSMQDAGKPILYVRLPDAGARSQSPPVFSLKRLFADSWNRWNAIDAPRLGAALAYYALLSLAPLLLLVVSVAGVFFRRSLIESGLIWQIQRLTGDIGTSLARSVLENTKSATGIIAGVLGILTMLLGASGVFLELRDSLDIVWDVKPPYGTGLFSLVRQRLVAFLMVIGTGLLLSVLIILSTVLATPLRFVLRFVPTSGFVAYGLSVSLSLIVMTAVFALIYKVVPDIQICWSDVWIGALVTSILFTAGKWLIGLYLSNAGIGSPYAAAGSLIVFLTWVYYSVQIFLFGAEFAHEYALRHGSYSHTGRHSPGFLRLRRPARN